MAIDCHGLDRAKQLTHPVILETDKKPWFSTHAYLYFMIMNYEYLITNTADISQDKFTKLKCAFAKS